MLYNSSKELFIIVQVIVKIKIRLTSALAILLSFNFMFAQKENTNHFPAAKDFNIGMFSVVGNNSTSPQPGTIEFRNELKIIREGTDRGYPAINSLHAYGHFISDSVYWTNYLLDISSVSDSLKTLADCNFEYIDTNSDSLISSDELNTFENVFEDFLNYPNTDHILGWYIMDEPSARGFNPVEVNKIYNSIKQMDDHPVYIAEAPSQPDYSRFMCDVLIIDDYYYTVNGFGDFFTLAAWRYLIPQAREQLNNAGRKETKIQALLVLGEEIFPDSLNEEYMESHGLTHSAIRTVLNLGADGVWFYAWRTGLIIEDDAVNRWLDQQYYAEAVETEFRDRDFLITVFNEQSGSKIYVSDIGTGQSLTEGFEYDFYININAVTSGDLQGSNDTDGKTILYDLSYKIDDGYRSNGDGDDELVTAFNNGKIYFNENGSQPDELEIGTDEGNVLAITSGDFDGDGDYELVTAIQNGDLCNIYLSDDAKVGSIEQYQIYSSGNLEITALTVCDFNGDGRDELVTALYDSILNQSYIYVDDIASTGTVAGNPPWFGPDNEFNVTSLTAGDFNDDNIYRDRLIFALSDTGLASTKIYCTGLNYFSFDSSLVFYESDLMHVTAMTSGDFTDDQKETKELVIALSNKSLNHALINKTDDPVVNGIGSVIYDSGTLPGLYVSSLTSASFRESLHPVTSVENGRRLNFNSVKSFKLYQNYPNPFNPVTHIGFRIANFGFVSLKVYDVLGNEIATLVNEEKSAGSYEVQFDASKLSSGVYFFRMQSGVFVQMNKMLLLR